MIRRAIYIYICKYNAQNRNHRHKVYDEVVNLQLKLLYIRFTMRIVIGRELIFSTQ